MLSDSLGRGPQGKTRLDGPELQARKDKIHVLLKRLSSGIHAIYLTDSEINDPQNNSLRQGIFLDFNRLDKTLAEYDRQVTDLKASTELELERELVATKQNLLWFLILGALVGLFAVYLIICVVQSRVKHLTDVIQQMGRGDFSVRSELVCADKLGNLSLVMNAVALSLAEKDTMI